MAEVGATVQHDERTGVFSIAVPGGVPGTLHYHLEKDSLGGTVINITHTFVPAAARGLGTAKTLSDAAFAFARTNSASVKPSCSYIKDTYLQKKADGKAFTYDETLNLVRLQ